MMDELARMQIEDGDTSALVFGEGAKEVWRLPLLTRHSSGIQPTEFKVLILPKPVDEKIGSLWKPPSTTESEKWATMEGTLVAVSPLAFTYAKEEEWRDAGAEPPAPGTRVLYAKYAGVHVKGRDGIDYVLCNDKDVMATLSD